MSDFPLCKAARLETEQMWPVNTVSYSGNKGYCVVKAEHVEAYLSTLKSTDKFSDGEVFKSAERLKAEWINQGPPFTGPSGVFKDPVLSERLRNVTLPWEDTKNHPNFAKFAKEKCMPTGDDRMSKMSDGFFKSDDFMLETNDLVSKHCGSIHKEAQRFADKANRLLQERMHELKILGFDAYQIEVLAHFYESKTGFNPHEHIKPIEKADTADGLLRELLKVCDEMIEEDDAACFYENRADVMKRAKKLLDNR